MFLLDHWRKINYPFTLLLFYPFNLFYDNIIFTELLILTSTVYIVTKEDCNNMSSYEPKLLLYYLIVQSGPLCLIKITVEVLNIILVTCFSLKGSDSELFSSKPH